jgi:hypothetical protein
MASARRRRPTPFKAAPFGTRSLHSYPPVYISAPPRPRTFGNFIDAVAPLALFVFFLWSLY